MMKCLILSLLAAFAALAPCAVAAAQEPTKLALEGQIKRADHQTYLEVPFDVPAGIERVTVTFDYNRDNRTVIDLGIYDPNGFRGWSGGNKRSFTIATSDATPSYMPGPITPGTWKLLLGVPNIREGSHATYSAEVTLTRANAPAPVSAFFDGPIRQGPGWYRGDFHSHTAHSDGSCDSLSGRRIPCPAFRTLEAAKRAGLDFIAVTEHNAASHHSVLRELQAYYDTMLIIPGREITTFYGHMNIFGPMAPVDFQLASPRLPQIGKLFDQVEAQGGIASINHPGMPSGEDCMGCGWVVKDIDYRRLAAVEIANGGTMRLIGSAEGRFSHIPFWEGLLNQGHRVTAIAGSDSHDPDAGVNRQFPVGKPSTVVFAEDLSQTAIFNGVRSGRVFVDLEGIAGRVVDLRASGREGEARMGGVLRLARGETGRLSIEVRGVENPTVQLVSGAGAPDLRLSERVLAQGVARFSAALPMKGRVYWVRANVRNARGDLIMVSNPIYIQQKPTSS
jgi:hypothetical protein